MSQSAPEPRRRRRWFSLSLRATMLLILLLGGLMGWKARRASIQRRAVERIERLGGSVEYDWQYRSDSSFVPSTTGPKIPGWLRKMLGDEYFQEVSKVTLQDDSKTAATTHLPRELPSEGPELQAVDEYFRKSRESKQEMIKDQLACLDGLDHLESLDLSGLRLESEGIARLGRLSRLKELTAFTPPDRNALDQLGQLTKLEALDIEIKLTDVSDLAFLEKLPRLRDLMISDLNISDAHLARVCRRSQLENLWLHGNCSAITDAGFAQLAGLRKLKSLALYFATNVSDAGLAHLRGLSELDYLELPWSPGITDEGLAQLTGLKKLHWLDLKSAANITDAGMVHLAGLTELDILSLDAKPLTDTGLAQLRGLSKLKVLDLSGDHLSHSALDGLRAAIPGLTIITQLREGPAGK